MLESVSVCDFYEFHVVWLGEMNGIEAYQFMLVYVYMPARVIVYVNI